MFYYLNGTVSLTADSLAVIDIGGVGYAVHTSQTTLSELTRGQTAMLYIHTLVREDAFDLYGFFSMEELSTFRMLLSISGVGPKAALSILSASSPSKIALGILSEDTDVFTIAPGIGKKIALRIVLELKDKLKKEHGLYDGPALSSSVGTLPKSDPVAEAIAALVVLGYSRLQAVSAVSFFASEDLRVEELITKALKRIQE